MKTRQNGNNYLLLFVGGIFAVALLVLAAFSFYPSEGCVGVIEIKGDITSEDSDATIFSDGAAGSGTIAEEIAAANGREDVKVIFLDIDSPGGSVVASREIYEALRAANKTKVAYINELAASGGYYAAAGTDYIVATPNALTGSIGSIITLSDMSGLFEKVGYNMTSVVSGEKKDMGSPSRHMTDSERAILQSIVNESFFEFRDAVIESRGTRLDMAQFNEVDDGRLLSGRQAKAVGLVDELGNRKAAIKRAAMLGGMGGGDPSICEISLGSKKRGIFSSLASQISEFFMGAEANSPRLLYR